MEKGDMAWGDFLKFLELFFNRERWCDIRWFDMLLEFSKIFLLKKYDVAWIEKGYVVWDDVTCYLNFQNYFLMKKGDMIWGDFLEFLELFLIEKDDVA
jgi:hypothetical protein